MEDLSMFQRLRTVALEDENPGTYGTVLIYPLNRLVECGFVGNTAVNPWVGIFCRCQGFPRERPLFWKMRTLGLMEGVDLPTRPIGRVWLRGLHAKHLYLGISGVYGDTRDISIHGLAPFYQILFIFLFNHIRESQINLVATPRAKRSSKMAPLPGS
ncbi:hypothetical protein PIB30_070795 [Stylosanthes scabra]|uniref:Uncharacterized protein n=1 Tax=Stylosanthes scabra TaxID=79078 RepID=A0ABU6YL61_9FABA|nr:hypothetical protein [Stylosanthes scabra]